MQRAISVPFMMTLMLVGRLWAGEANPPPVNEEKPPQATVKIIEHYPTNNKILIGGTGNTTVIKSLVTPVDVNDHGTYTWSYAKDLGWNTNGQPQSVWTTIHSLPDPFPDTKDSEKQKVIFVSSNGRGTSSDERALNIVAPLHFALNVSSPPAPVITQIELPKVAAIYSLIRIRVDYTIKDQYKEKLANDTATFCGNHVQTAEAVPWNSAVGLPPPEKIQATFKNNDSGTQSDEIFVPMKGTKIVKSGIFDPDLVGKDIVMVVPHVWKTKTQNTEKISDVTNNELHIVLVSITNLGQLATIKATYTVTTP